MYRLYRNKSMCGNKRLQCVRLIFVLVWKKNLYGNKSLHRNKKCLGFSVGCTRYVCTSSTWYLRTRVGYVLCSTWYIRTTWDQLVCTWCEPAPKIRICRYLCTRATSKKKTSCPWTHTSDDSYIYQLSLVIATATVS